MKKNLIKNPTVINELEKYLMSYTPQSYLPKYVNSIQDLYQKRVYIKPLPCNDYCVRFVANLILSALKNNKRFKQSECLKVLKSIVKEQHDPELSEDTIALLFELYKHYIFSNNEEIQWCVSSIIKNRPLSDSEILWLIEQYKKSGHLINRLLRYPFKNELIISWARNVYQTGNLQERNSELLGILIEHDIPTYASKESSDTLIWAVYYSKTSRKTKAKLLENVFTEESIKSFIEVCQRLELMNVIKKVLNKISC